MAVVYLDIEHPMTGAKQGSGPITSASKWRYTARMDKAGSFSFEMPAGDPKAVTVRKKYIVRAYCLLNGQRVEVGAGIIDQIEKVPQNDGTVSLRVSGDDLIRELTYRSVLNLKLYLGGNPVSHATAVAAVATYAPAGWVFTPDGAPPNDSIYGYFNGETVLQGAIKVAEKSQNHFYRGSGRTLIFASTFTASGVRAIQARGDLTANTCAITSLSERVDTYDLITRIYPRGSGNANVQLTLRATTRVAPAGYTLNATGNYIEYDAGVVTYGRIERQIDYRDIGPIENTNADVVAASNALFDAALETLKRQSSELEQATYTLQVAGCSQLLRPMQSIRLVYRDSLAGLNINTDLNILEATWQVDESGIYTTDLVVSNADRWPKSDVGTIVDGIAEGHVYQALPQLNANSYVTAYNKLVDPNYIAAFRFRFGNEVTQLQQVLFEVQILPLESSVRTIGGDSSGSGDIPTGGPSTDESGSGGNNDSGVGGPTESGSTTPTIGSGSGTIGSATPAIGSETPTIGTVTPTIGTVTPTIGASTPDIGSVTPAIGSTTPAIGSETPTIGSATPTVSSTTPTIGSATPDIGEETPAIGSATPTVSSTTPTIGSGSGTIGASTPDIGEETPTIGSTTPTVGSTTPTIGSTTPTIGSTTPVIGDTPLQTLSEELTLSGSTPIIGSTELDTSDAELTTSSVTPTLGSATPTIGDKALTSAGATPNIGDKALTSAGATPNIGDTTVTVQGTSLITAGQSLETNEPTGGDIVSGGQHGHGLVVFAGSGNQGSVQLHDLGGGNYELRNNSIGGAVQPNSVTLGGDHTHDVDSHDHSISSHTHTIAAHSHTVASHDHTIAVHSHTIASHDHTIAVHTHTIAAHNHTITAHTHTITAHTHTIAAHNHSIDPHNHTIDPHRHTIDDHSHSIAAHDHTIAVHTHTIAAHTHTLTAHTHTLTAHTHTIASHDHTIASHTHTLTAHTHTLTAHTHSIALHTHTIAGHDHTIAAHTHTLTAHNHTLTAHTHTIEAHTHTIAAHTHTIAAHDHTIAAHTHTITSHTHTISAHSHTIEAHTHTIAAHTHTITAHTHTISAHTHSLSSHTHSLNNHTHDLSESITAIYGIFRADLADTYALADLDYRVNGGSWLNMEDDAVDAGDGWWQIDLTSLVMDATTFRPVQANNLLEIRSNPAMSITSIVPNGLEMATEIVVTDSSGFAAGDMILVSGTTNFNGVYEVDSVGPGPNTIYVLPLVAGAEETTGTVALVKSAQLDAQLSVRNIIQAIAYA